MIRLRQHIHDDRHKQEVSVCREESEGVRRRGLEERMVSETEIQSLKTQVNILQKVRFIFNYWLCIKQLNLSLYIRIPLN